MAEIIGHGSSISVNDGASSSFVAALNVTSITVPAEETDFVEITSMDSPNRSREYIPGLSESGEMSFTARFTSEEFERFFDLMEVSKLWEVSFGNDDLVLEFGGYVKKVESTIENESVVDYTVTVKLTGAVTIDE